ncbi:MAG: LLM class flavin-dependent oxidoreductase [Mycobacterium sp.]
MADADRELMATAVDIPFVGGVGLEIHRTAGIDNAIHGLKVLDALGYPMACFSEQAQSWVFRSAWGPDISDAASEVPEYEAFYDTFSLMAAGATATNSIGLATMTDCYRRAPSVLAQTMLTLDHLSHGRVSLLIGTGENKQFVPYGLERTTPRNQHLEESIRAIKALMSARDPVTLEGEFFPLRDALLGLEPFDPNRPPPVFLLGGGPTAVKIAGRVADGLGTYTPGGYDDDVSGFEEDLHTMWSEAEAHGRDPSQLIVFPANTMVLCEDDTQVERALDSLYVKAFALNLTQTGAHWSRWGSSHPLGDKWALSRTHRSTLFTRDELEAHCKNISTNDIQHVIYVGLPEDVATRSAKWFKAARVPQVPVPMATANFGTTLFPEQHQLADDGLPRWHHLQIRYATELNRRLSSN